MIAACVVAGGVSALPALAWLAIPIVTLSARFSYRGIVLGVDISLTLMFGVASAAETT